MNKRTSPQAAPAPPVVSKRWWWAVRVLSFLTLLIFFPGVLLSSVYLFPFGLIPAAGFVWVAYSLSRNLDAPDPKKGLALAVWVGAATLLIVVLLAATLTEGLTGWGALALVPISLATTAILALRAAAGEHKGGLVLGTALHGFVYLLALLIPLSISIPGLIRSRIAVNHASAVGSLRTINSAMTTYESTYHNGFAPGLKTLGPPEPPHPGKGTSPAAPSCQAANLIGEVLASGRKSGYVFELVPGPGAENTSPGCPAGVKSYTVTARPVNYSSTGMNSYFTDQTGVIRSTSENRPATTKDPPIAE